MKEIVSVIVPIYNTSRYLEKCIKTLINQTYKDIEIILVNDGSTDRSLEICEKYRKIDDRIILVNKQNEGIERARKSGYVMATGKWVVYVDSDDYLPIHAIEAMMKYTTDDNDIVIGSWSRVLDGRGLIKKKYEMKSSVIDNQTLMSKYYISFFGVNILPVNVWGKIYRKELLDNAKIEETNLRHGEDLCYNMQAFPYAKKIVTIQEQVYNYRWGGMTERMNYNLLSDAKHAFNLKVEMLNKYQVKDGLRCTVIELKNFFITFMENYMMFTKHSRKEIIDICQKEWESKELQYAKSILSKVNVNYDEKTQCFLSGDLAKLYDLLKKNIFKKKIKRKVFSLICSIVRI